LDELGSGNEHSVLFARSVSDKEKKFNNFDTRGHIDNLRNLIYTEWSWEFVHILAAKTVVL
jgi:hypothetical protein